MIDAVVTLFFRNIVIHRIASIHGYAAKQAPDRKLLDDMTSADGALEPIAAIHGGSHVLVPFAIEDGGRLGAHAQAILTAMATLALDKCMRPPFAHRAHTHFAPTPASA